MWSLGFSRSKPSWEKVIETWSGEGGVPRETMTVRRHHPQWQGIASLEKYLPSQGSETASSGQEVVKGMVRNPSGQRQSVLGQTGVSHTMHIEGNQGRASRSEK